MSVGRCVRNAMTLIMMIGLAACGNASKGGTTVVQTKMGGAVQGSALALVNSVTTFAGTTGSSDGIKAAARFNLPSDVATDGTSLFVVDSGNSIIRKIEIATGATTTLAGSAGFTGSSDGNGAAARFNNPYGIVISKDKAALYVTDSANNTIRKVTIASGAVTTLAGTAGVIGASNGSGAAASFNSPTGITTDGTNLYVADSFNNSIRQIAISSGAVATLAGSGSQGFADGSGTAASFSNPYGVATDGTSIYLTDNGNGSIRRIVIATGVVSTLVEPGAGFVSPAGITTDGTTLYVTDADRNVVRRVIIATQAVATVAGDAINGTPGSTDGTGGAARFVAPGGITMDGANLYLADTDNGTIRNLAISTGVVSTLAGTPGAADGAGAVAAFSSPYGITTDGSNIYVADAGNATIRKIVIATGVVSTLAGSAGVTGAADGAGTASSFNFPSGITTDGINLYVADTDNHTVCKIVIATGVVSTLAGTAGHAGSADGTGSTAGFRSPGGITTDGTNLYLADTGNNLVRLIAIATGEVTTLAGSAAGLSSPYDISTDGTNLYLADAGNNAIRKISIATKVVSTLAITGATLDFPTGVTTDGKHLYVADSGNGAIRKIEIATGAASTVSAGFSNPSGITTDGKNLYVADVQDNTIAKIR